MHDLERLAGISIWIVFFLFVVILIEFIISTSFKKDDKWTCETCDMELTRKQIKFGLCPYCGKKVKNFRGLHRW
jgi:rRNA maturation endonuclease Nob1